MYRVTAVSGLTCAPVWGLRPSASASDTGAPRWRGVAARLGAKADARPQRRWIVGIALTVALAVSGCSDDAPPAADSSPRATSASPTTKPPTPEEVAAHAATATFEEMLRVTDAASRDPGIRDWEPEIRQYAADPAAYLAVQAVRDYAVLGLRQAGDSEVDVDVTNVDLVAPEGPTVAIRGCYDSQSAQVLKVDTGEVIPSGTPPRYVWDIKVIQYRSEPGEPWLVSMLEPLTDQPC